MSNEMYQYCKLVESEHLLFCVTTDDYFVLYLWCQILACCHIYTAAVEFPCPNKIDHLTYMTETERPNNWVYLYNIKNYGFLDIKFKTTNKT
jgi:hypothetical protein